MNGMSIKSGNTGDLAEKIKAMFSTKFDYTAIANAAIERYNAESYYNEIMKIYGNNA